MPILVERRLMAMGDNGLVVYIPTAWARYYGLRKGDIVEVVANGELTIRPKLKANLPPEAPLENLTTK